jgi:hypothetical protein
MIDHKSQFLAILTAVGEAKQANADALGIPWKITQMGVGDANGRDPIPDRLQTALIKERRRAPLNQLTTDAKNPGLVIAEQVIPADVGGWWVREVGLYDADGDLVAVSNCAPSYKPLLGQGSGRTQVVRMTFIISSTANVVLKIDPSVVLATREYVDSRITEQLFKLDNKQSVRLATTANINLAGLHVLDTQKLVAGDRVLVKNQTVTKENGIYIANPNIWERSPDTNNNSEVTSALLVSVEQGATQADTRWQLVTDGPIVVGTTALKFQNVSAGFAPLKSPALTNPTANTPPRFNSSGALATTEFVIRNQGSYSDSVMYKDKVALTSADVGRLVSITGTTATITLPDGKAVPPGSLITVLSRATGVLTAAPFSGQALHTLSGASGSISLTPSSMAIFRRADDANGWILEGGDAALKYSPAFSVRNMSSGYKQPGGAIEQWGTGQCDANGYVYITFPMAFPVAMRNICVLHNGTAGLIGCVINGSVKSTGCTIRVQNADGSTQPGWGVLWRAVGV